MASKQVIVGGMDKSEIPAFLRGVGVYALQKQAGFIPDSLTVTGDEPLFDSLFHYDDTHGTWIVLAGIMEYVLGEGLTHTEQLLTVIQDFDNMVVHRPQGFVRDMYYREYGLPDFRKDMTIEQQRMADAIEERLKDDIYLEREGKMRCHYTGVISVITDDWRERKRQVERLSQVEINRGFKV